MFCGGGGEGTVYDLRWPTESPWMDHGCVLQGATDRHPKKQKNAVPDRVNAKRHETLWTRTPHVTAPLRLPLPCHVRDGGGTVRVASIQYSTYPQQMANPVTTIKRSCRIATPQNEISIDCGAQITNYIVTVAGLNCNCVSPAS